MRFVFGDYLLDPDRRELTRLAEVVAIGPQVFDLLVHLIQNRERVVSKDSLLGAVWDGRIVSEATITSHINAARKAVGDNGQEQRLIRTIARKGFRFIGDVMEVDSSVGSGFRMTGAGPAELDEPSEHSMPLPDKPSIAVMPFRNLSGDPEQEYFTDGIVEDIISALSHNRWLFVIARNSSFTYKDKTVDVKQVGGELGVRYVLEGSVRQASNRVRITGQLIDATTGGHLWADRFEGTLDNIFELQDHVAESVVGAIAPQLERAEIERARRKPTESLDAYDCYLRGVADMQKGTKEATSDALMLFYKAVQLDPDFASAYGMAAWCYVWRKIMGWMTDRAQEMIEGVRLARRAIELDNDDAVALTRSGPALAHLAGDLDGGIELLDRAVLLNPNLAAAWFLSGFLRTWRGEPEIAIEHLTRAMRLNPLDPEMFRMQTGMAAAHLFARRFDDASLWAEKSFRYLPTFVVAVSTIAASHALAGRTDKAQEAMNRLRQLHPTLRISNLTDWQPIRRPDDLALLVEGLRKAGLPE